MNADIKHTVKEYTTCLEYQQMQPHRKMIPHEMMCKAWELVGSDIFSINNNTLLHIVYYYRKFPIVKGVEGLSADDLIRAAKIVFPEFGLLKKIVSDVVTTSYHINLNNFAGD